MKLVLSRKDDGGATAARHAPCYNRLNWDEIISGERGMSRRFFVKGPLLAGPWHLEGAEAHHLVRVLRIGVGQCVVLFDGGDFEAPAEIVRISQDGVDFQVAEPRRALTEPTLETTLAVAVPKGDRFAWLVEKATELGVRRLIPLLTERSIVDPGAGKLEKMRRTIIEASKQCRRSRLMELEAPLSWSNFLERELPGSIAWVAHPQGVPLRELTIPHAGRAVAAIGPEGGFTDREVALAAEQGAELVSLGPRVLRIETAALAVAAIFHLR